MPQDTFSEFLASYYDEIYQNKEYMKEIEYVDGLLQEYCGEVNSILDVDCGTGTHGIMLAERQGYSVVGIDSSEDMIAEAQRKIDRSDTEDFSVFVEEIENLNLDREFDVVLAQFGVFGYISDNETLIDAFNTIRSHIADDGLFVFDTWYGPAVFSDYPHPVQEEIDVSDGTIFKHINPEFYPQENVAELSFNYLHIDADETVTRFGEMHRIRCYFRPEIDLLARFSGFSLVDTHPYREPEDSLSDEDWNATWVLQPDEMPQSG